MAGLPGLNGGGAAAAVPVMVTVKHHVYNYRNCIRDEVAYLIFMVA